MVGPVQSVRVYEPLISPVPEHEPEPDLDFPGAPIPANTVNPAGGHDDDETQEALAAGRATTTSTTRTKARPRGLCG